MADPDWQQVIEEIRRLLDTYRGQLAPDAADAVNHYVEHDEYELALEGLCLELVDLPEFASSDRIRCIQLAQRLGLDTGSVFDSTFWRRLVGNSGDRFPENGEKER